MSRRHRNRRPRVQRLPWDEPVWCQYCGDAPVSFLVVCDCCGEEAGVCSFCHAIGHVGEP